MSESAIQEVICGMGYPVGGNPMQLLMERAFAAAGLDARFLTFEVDPDRLPDALAGMKAMKFSGAAMMTPHASHVIDSLDRMSPAAELAGAANCLVREGDEWVGENTLGSGLIRALPEALELDGKQVMILGAGAVGRSVAVALSELPIAGLHLWDEVPQRGRDFVERLNEVRNIEVHFQPWNSVLAIPEEIGLLIHATSLEWCDPQAVLPIQLESLSSDAQVIDLNYNPPETWLLREAKARGCQVQNGIGMLVQQAALSFEKWTQSEADVALLRESAEEYLEV